MLCLCVGQERYVKRKKTRAHPPSVNTEPPVSSWDLPSTAPVHLGICLTCVCVCVGGGVYLSVPVTVCVCVWRGGGGT